MLSILLLLAAMFIMIVTLGSLFLMHLRDHEREEIEAEDFARKLLDRIREQLDGTDEEP